MGHLIVVMYNVILKQLKYIFTFSHSPFKLKIISIVVTLYKADMCNCSEPFTVISKTCEVGHPCKSATCHSWPYFREPKNLYDIHVIIAYCGHLLILDLGHSFIFSAMVSVQVQPSCVGRSKQFSSFSIIVYKSQYPHSIAQPPVVHPTSIVSPWVWTIYWNFLVAIDPILYCNATLHRQGYVHAFQPDHPSLHSDLYICKSYNAHFNSHSVKWFP